MHRLNVFVDSSTHTSVRLVPRDFSSAFSTRQCYILAYNYLNSSVPSALWIIE